MKTQSFKEMLGALESELAGKLREKVPAWAAAAEAAEAAAEAAAAALRDPQTPGLRVPCKLALEQCSSQAAALYKASIAPDGRVVDLTSGLGVDVWSFARRKGALETLYNDLNTELCRAAEHNFSILGLDNIRISNLDAPQCLENCGKADLIFIDPARRSSTGSKVFRLEDCSPDLRNLLPLMWEHTGTVMAKLSPMADISLISNQLDCLSEVHVVGTSSECKELLCIFRKGWEGPYSVKAVLLRSGSDVPDVITIPQDNRPAEGMSGTETPLKEGGFIYEPIAILRKTGLYNNIGRLFNLHQLDPSVHLFVRGTSDTEGPIGEQGRFFKRFRVIEVCEFGKQSFGITGKKYADAEVSARNLPVKSEDLKRKLGCKGGGKHHIFGIRCGGRKMLVVTEVA